jgi:hypothetical protein
MYTFKSILILTLTIIQIYFINANPNPNLKVYPNISYLNGDCLCLLNGVDSQLESCPNEIEVCGWFGIPYALPPVGYLRFRKPVPISESWKYRYIKNEMPPSCNQYYLLDPTVTLPGQIRNLNSEDCLYLNIWTPCCEGNCKLPVLVSL